MRIFNKSGGVYINYDPGLGREVRIEADAIGEVSDAKGAQMLADLPDWFTQADATGADVGDASVVADAGQMQLPDAPADATKATGDDASDGDPKAKKTGK